MISMHAWIAIQSGRACIFGEIKPVNIVIFHNFEFIKLD